MGIAHKEEHPEVMPGRGWFEGEHRRLIDAILD
jgi:hypothetical protein